MLGDLWELCCHNTSAYSEYATAQMMLQTGHESAKVNISAPVWSWTLLHDYSVDPADIGIDEDTNTVTTATAFNMPIAR